MDTLSKLYQIKYGVPEGDISLRSFDFDTYGSTEQVQVNSWWTPTEDWPIERMFQAACDQIAIVIHTLSLPANKTISATLEQKGVDERFIKTIFAIGEKDAQGSIWISQEKPVMGEDGRQLMNEEGKPWYEMVDVEYTPDVILKLINGLEID